VHPTIGYRFDHDGASVVCAGDTVPCDGLTRLVEGADVYVQTVIRNDLIEAIGLPRLMDVRDYHSTVQQAAQTAAAAGVRTLVLTHMVPAPPPGAGQDWADMAAEHFDGEIVVAEDMTRLEI
jgi:ribonuclease Z